MGTLMLFNHLLGVIELGDGPPKRWREEEQITKRISVTRKRHVFPWSKKTLEDMVMVAEVGKKRKVSWEH